MLSVMERQQPLFTQPLHSTTSQQVSNTWSTPHHSSSQRRAITKMEDRPAELDRLFPVTPGSVLPCGAPGQLGLCSESARSSWDPRLAEITVPHRTTHSRRPPPGLQPPQAPATNSLDWKAPVWGLLAPVGSDTNSSSAAQDSLTRQHTGVTGPALTPSDRLYSPWSVGVDGEESSDSDDASPSSHPNKFPVEIEHHNSRFCSYKRQGARSGEKMKQKLVHSYDPLTLQPQTSLQQTKYYQKHLVRICKCGKYQMMDGALQQGRSNDCNGYEIHYSHKCRWKAYDDFKTGNRVLIRLCKCYRPPV